MLGFAIDFQLTHFIVKSQSASSITELDLLPNYSHGMIPWPAIYELRFFFFLIYSVERFFFSLTLPILNFLAIKSNRFLNQP